MELAAKEGDKTLPYCHPNVISHEVGLKCRLCPFLPGTHPSRDEDGENDY
jgi:hypothetical protein